MMTVMSCQRTAGFRISWGTDTTCRLLWAWPSAYTSSSSLDTSFFPRNRWNADARDANTGSKSYISQSNVHKPGVTVHFIQGRVHHGNHNILLMRALMGRLAGEPLRFRVCIPLGSKHTAHTSSTCTVCLLNSFNELHK